jgi:hypothetical protein
LDMHRVAAKFVPRILTADQKHHWWFSTLWLLPIS